MSSSIGKKSGYATYETAEKAALAIKGSAAGGGL
jgi:hypothetical protein